VARLDDLGGTEQRRRSFQGRRRRKGEIRPASPSRTCKKKKGQKTGHGAKKRLYLPGPEKSPSLRVKERMKERKRERFLEKKASSGYGRSEKKEWEGYRITQRKREVEEGMLMEERISRLLEILKKKREGGRAR